MTVLGTKPLLKWPTTLQVKTKSAADDKLIEDYTYRETWST